MCSSRREQQGDVWHLQATLNKCTDKTGELLVQCFVQEGNDRLSSETDMLIAQAW